MAQDIRHQGTVDSIDGQKVNVRITQSSACGGCQARNICRAAESKEKVVEVLCADAAALHVGQEVTVAGAGSLGLTKLEASGGITIERLPEIGRLGVDFVSSGALTHSVKAADISLDIEM